MVITACPKNVSVLVFVTLTPTDYSLSQLLKQLKQSCQYVIEIINMDIK